MMKLPVIYPKYIPGGQYKITHFLTYFVTVYFVILSSGLAALISMGHPSFDRGLALVLLIVSVFINTVTYLRIRISGHNSPIQYMSGITAFLTIPFALFFYILGPSIFCPIATSLCVVP